MIFLQGGDLRTFGILRQEEIGDGGGIGVNQSGPPLDWVSFG